MNSCKFKDYNQLVDEQSIQFVQSNIKVSMGNYVWCRQNSSSGCFGKRSDKQQTLKRTYRKFIKDSEFKDACLDTIHRNFNESLELENEEILRKSIVYTSHYETNSLNESINNYDEQSECSTPTRKTKNQPFLQLPAAVSSMPPEQKKIYILNLIKESYLFIDLTDCLQDKNTIQYQKIIKHELMKNDVNLDSSFIRDDSSLVKLEECLKSCNQEMILLLQNYVRFCRKVNFDFNIENQRFLGKLCLNLQGQIIRKNDKKQFRRNKDNLLELVQDVKEVIKILELTLYTFYQVGINTQKQDYSPAFDFYNQMNMHTLITSLMFKNQEFNAFFMVKIKDCFIDQFKKYKKEPQYSVSMFINDFIELNSRNSRQLQSIKTELTNLFDSSKNLYGQIPIFRRSRQILLKILQKPLPLYKLKIIYQLNKEMNRQLQQLRDILLKKFNIQINNVFTRETEYLIIQWFLKSHKDKIEKICAHLLFTYFFIHEYYKIDKKGSCLITFIQQIQRIVLWNKKN